MAAPLLPFNPRTTVGAWFGGNMVALGLEGVLFMLTMRYYTHARRDMLYIRVLVHALFFMNVLKSMQTVAVMWNQQVSGFSNPDSFLAPPWYIKCDPYNSVLIKLVGQIFFAIRLWRVMRAGHWLVFGPLITAMLLAFAGATATLVYMLQSSTALPDDTMHKVFIVMTSSAAGILVSDLLITCTTAYCFLRLKVGSRSADGLLDRLVHLTFVTAALPMLVCAIGLGFFVSSGFDGANDVFLASTLIAPRMYSIAVMHTLNIFPFRFPIVGYCRRGQFASRLEEDQRHAIDDLHLTTRDLGSKAACSCPPVPADPEAAEAALALSTVLVASRPGMTDNPGPGMAVT